MSRLRDLERRIDETLRGMLRSSSPDQKRELLEIHRALLDDVTAHVDTLRRGKQTFPYTQLQVQILLPDPALRRSYELVFVEADADYVGIDLLRRAFLGPDDRRRHQFEFTAVNCHSGAQKLGVPVRGRHDLHDRRNWRGRSECGLALVPIRRLLKGVSEREYFAFGEVRAGDHEAYG